MYMRDRVEHVLADFLARRFSALSGRRGLLRILFRISQLIYFLGAARQIVRRCAPPFKRGRGDPDRKYLFKPIPCPAARSSSPLACAGPCAYEHWCACAGLASAGPCDAEFLGSSPNPSGALC